MTSKVALEIVTSITFDQTRSQDADSLSPFSSPENNHISYSSSQKNASLPVIRKVSYNQKVEQDIIQEVILFIQKEALASSINTSNFNIVVADGKELYENKVAEICSKTGIAEKIAKSQVYIMIKASLPKVSDLNLYKKTQRAESVYKLFGKIIDPITKKEVKGIGIDKAYGISYGVRSILKLTDSQILNIIDQTSKKILPEENSSLSADLENYIKMLTGSLEDEIAYWGTPYENSARVVEEKANEVKKLPRVQSNDDLKQPGFQDFGQEELNDRAFPTKIKTRSIPLPDSNCKKSLNNLHFNRIIQIVIRIFVAKPRCSDGVNKGQGIIQA
ncbi:14197_t:CDS:2, partial [Funneliformis mosseae]